MKRKMIDADTYGKQWATAIVDGVYTQAEKVESKKNNLPSCIWFRDMV